MKISKVVIDPRFRMSYASFYLEGLTKVYGVGNIHYELQPDYLYNNKYDYDKGFSFIVDKKKVYIDFGDSSEISSVHYEWCDLYAKINCFESDLVLFSKLRAIGPSFGINILNTYYLKVLTKVFFAKNKPVKFSDYVKDYLFLLIRRKPLNSYLGSKSDIDYVFSISTLWYDKLTAETTNLLRGQFLTICRKIFKKNEGGFFYIENVNVLKEFPQYINYKSIYKDFIYSRRISPSRYISKTKKSCVVFNTPSVGGCLGWKLGEYFAMGKAVISTPINHSMPKNLTDEIVFVENGHSIEDSILRIKNDSEFRKKLELNASAYFENYLRPSAVIKSLID